MSDNNVDLSLFSQDHYLAFALSEKTRQELIKAIGARFEVRVCHHVTLHYDIPEPGEPTTLDYYMANFGGFVTMGYMVTPHQVVIAVSGGLNGRFRPIYDETNPRDVLHITYERDRTVKDGASADVFSNEVPYVFHPLSVELEGTFQMLPKNGKTPTEINQAWVEFKIAEVSQQKKEHYQFSNSYFHGHQLWVALNINGDGIPAAFLYRNKNGPSRSVERGDPEFIDLLDAWRVWAIGQLRSDRRYSRLTNPPQPRPISEHATLCSEVELPGGRSPCVAGQPNIHFVEVRNLLGVPNVWMAEGFSTEGLPLAFVGTSITGVGIEVKMDLNPNSDYMKLYHVWLSQKRRSARTTVKVEVIELDADIFKPDNLEMPAVLVDSFSHLPLPTMTEGGRVATELDTVGAENNLYTGHNFNYAGYPTVFHSGSHDTPGVHYLDNSPTGDIHLFIGYLMMWCEKNNVRVPADARYTTFNDRTRHQSTCSEECRMNML